MVFKVLGVLALIGCGRQPPAKTNFVEMFAPRELEIGRTFLKQKYNVGWHIDPDFYRAPAADVEMVCMAEVVGCVVSGHIVYADDADPCQVILHELGHWSEMPQYDYAHTGKLARWYTHDVFYLCEALSE